MILVTLGTQDKSFERLLRAVLTQIEAGNISEEVIVQAGCTKFKSDKMKIFDLIEPYELEKLIKKARIVITHGGVGSILTALKYQKPVIAAARLSEYDEHTNDHQMQILEEFKKEGYVLVLEDFEKLDELLLESKTFKPKRYQSNNQKFVQFIENYIKEDNHISWWNRYCKFILFLLFCLIAIGGFILWKRFQ